MDQWLQHCTLCCLSRTLISISTILNIINEVDSRCPAIDALRLLLECREVWWEPTRHLALHYLAFNTKTCIFKKKKIKKQRDGTGNSKEGKKKNAHMMNSLGWQTVVATPPSTIQGFTTVWPPVTEVPASSAASLKPWIISGITLSLSYANTRQKYHQRKKLVRTILKRFSERFHILPFRTVCY